MKRSKLLIEVFAIPLLLTACVVTTGHEHTFAEGWSNNENYHWHGATCGHNDITKDLEPHIFGDDNVCDVCGYVKPAPAHEHTYSEEWSQNDYMHWHAASCGHSELNKDLGEHIYDEDGFCIVCNYETPEHFRRLNFDVRNARVEGNTRLRFNTKVTFQIIPDEGYKLPLQVTSSGFTDFSYNSETGVCEGKVTGETVKVSSRALPLTNKYAVKSDSFINSYKETGYIDEYDYNQTTKHLKVDHKDYQGTLVSSVEYDYNNLNEKIKESVFNAELDYVTVTDYTYNEKGLLIKEEISNNQSGEFVDTHFIEYSYLENGRLENKNTYSVGLTKWITSIQHTYEEGEYGSVPQVVETVDTLQRESQDAEPHLVDRIKYVKRNNYPFENENYVETTEYDVDGETITESSTYRDRYYINNGRLCEHVEHDYELFDRYNEYGDIAYSTHYAVTYGYDYVAGSWSSTTTDRTEQFIYDEYGNISSYICNLDGYNGIVQDNFLTGKFVHNENDLLIEAKYTHYLRGQVLTRNIDYMNIDPNGFIPSEMKLGICVENYNELYHKPVMDF